MNSDLGKKKRAIVPVALALVHQGRRWLVAKRPSHVHLAGFWEFPGGKIERDESIATAAIRELKEECGVSAVVERELAPVDWSFEERCVTLYPVICRWDAGDAQPLHGDECRWVTIVELRDLRMPGSNEGIIAALEQYVADNMSS